MSKHVRKCRQCGTEIGEHNTYSVHRQGNICKSCHSARYRTPEANASVRSRERARRRRVIEMLGGACNCCGQTREWFLEIHHLEARAYPRQKGDKLVRDLANGSYSLDSVELLCANCHREKTLRGACECQESPPP